MGRIDVVIPDDLEAQFRIEVIKRFGGKKGDLQRAIKEAIELWIKSDIIDKIKQKALSGFVTTQELKNIVDALVAQGKASLPALADILRKRTLTTAETQYITRAIRQLSTKPEGS